MNTENWAARLLDAIEADDRVPHPTGDRPDPAEPEPAGPADGVPDWVLVAAMIGHPAEGDADAILADPAALQRLREHWARNPPDAALVAAAADRPVLRRLLDATRNAGANPSTGSAGAHAAARRHGYRLAAATQEQARTTDFPGGRLTTKALEDGATSVAVEYAAYLAATLPPTQLVAWVGSAAGDPAQRFLVILVRSGTAADSGLIGRINLPAGSAVSAKSPSRPLPISDLWTRGELDADAVSRSVACAPLVWKEAWRQVALRVGSAHPFARAVERGLSRRPG